MSRRTPSVPRAGGRSCRCVAWTAPSASFGAWCGVCPNTSTICTSSPTTARRPARPTRTSPGGSASSGGSSTSSWPRRESAAPEPRPIGLARGIGARRWGATELFQHFLNYLDEDFLRRREPEAHQQDGIRVITAGPNAFLYVLDVTTPLDADALEHRFPGLAEKLSRSPGVGFVLARSGNGPLCFWHGKRYQLCESEPGPFTRRADASVVLKGIADLMTMPSAGDLVIYGIDAPEGHVSFIPELGAHAGPSPEELHTFIMRPAKVILPSPISHPIQLYEHFIRYQEPS